MALNRAGNLAAAAIVAGCVWSMPSLAVFEDITPPAKPAPARVAGQARGGGSGGGVVVEGDCERGIVDGWGTSVPLHAAIKAVMPGWALSPDPHTLREQRVSWKGSAKTTWEDVLREWSREHGWRITVDCDRRRVVVRKGGAALAGGRVPPSFARMSMTEFINGKVKIFAKGKSFEEVLRQLLPRGWKIEIQPEIAGRLKERRYDLVAEDRRDRVLSQFLQHERLIGAPYPGLGVFVVHGRN